jgi:prepilin-type N-terminal cleavage/methylation domain-containing protein
MSILAFTDTNVTERQPRVVIHMKSVLSMQRGFSLIELLIVCAVIAIIAAIAVPWLIAAKQAARAGSAVASLRLIHQCESSYRASSGRYGDLMALNTAGFLSDPDIAAGAKQQYLVTVTPDLTDPSLDYEAEAQPTTAPTTLWFHYYVNGTGVIRVKQGARATKTDPPID